MKPRCPWLTLDQLLMFGYTLLALSLVAATRGAAGEPAVAVAGRAHFSVRDFGAKGDGQALDTAAINRAVEACAADGGGQVVFPPGRYLSGTIQLRSHITVFLEAGATIIGSTNLADYHRFIPPAGTAESRFQSNWHRALVLGDGLEEVSLIGPGVIDGNKVFDPHGEEHMRGPHTILLGNSRRLTFRDFAVRDSANYGVFLEDCQQVEFRNLKITGGWDGIHFRGFPGRPCREVSIVGCQLFTGDDAIAGRYWENTLIADCIVNSSCNGLRLIGPATGLVVHNCLFYGPGLYPHRSSKRNNMLAGLCLQPGAWDATEGTLDNVLVSGLTMHNVSTPFHFALKPGNTAGTIRVSDVTASGVYRAASSVESWAEGPFTNVVFCNVTIDYEGGGGPSRTNRPVQAPGVDARPLPAWGFYAHNLQNLTLENVRLTCAKDDLRPVVLAEGVERLTLYDFKYPKVRGAAEALALTNVVETRVNWDKRQD